jgi:hypothetical protein
MGEEAKATCTDETALKWATKVVHVFNCVSTMQTMCHHIPKFVLGGDRTAEEGKPLMRVGDMLTGKDTFTIIDSSMEEVTKIKALHAPQIVEACL